MLKIDHFKQPQFSFLQKKKKGGKSSVFHGLNWADFLKSRNGCFPFSSFWDNFCDQKNESLLFFKTSSCKKIAKFLFLIAFVGPLGGLPVGGEGVDHAVGRELHLADELLAVLQSEVPLQDVVAGLLNQNPEKIGLKTLS